MRNFKLILLICLLVCLSAFEVHGPSDHSIEHTCNHDNEEFNPGFLDVDEASPDDDIDGRSLLTAPNIRIYPHYDTLKGGSAAFRSYVRYELIPPVLDFFRAALRIRYPLRSPLKVGRNVRYLCETPTPRILQTTGVSADYFFFFTIGSGGGNFVATSKFCHLSSGTNRPIISRVKFNMGGLKLPKGDVLKHEDNTYVLIHEMMHSFGFSSSLFPYFVDERGRQRRGHVKRVNLHGSTRKVLDIPVLTNRVRRHFGCSSLPGAYLENNGDAMLTAGSHFERKHFLMDLMTSGMLHGRRVSELSLAVLEGSGWYIPNYSFAEPNPFGAGQGCGFINNKCSNVNRFEEFCVKSREKGCFASGMGGGICKGDKNADGCRYHNPSLLFDCESHKAAKQTRLANLQAFGRGVGSRCFEGTLSTRSHDKQNTFCFKYDCSGSGVRTQLAIQVGRHRVVCRKAGYVQVSGYQGNIKCPDPLHFCQTAGRRYCPRGCMGRGKCMNGQCRCYRGYSGVDCGLRD